MRLFKIFAKLHYLRVSYTLSVNSNAALCFLSISSSFSPLRNAREGRSGRGRLERTDKYLLNVPRNAKQHVNSLEKPNSTYGGRVCRREDPRNRLWWYIYVCVCKILHGGDGTFQNGEMEMSGGVWELAHYESQFITE